MQERLPYATQISCFGSTEYGGFACLGAADDPLEARPTTSGRPLARHRDPRSSTPRPARTLPPGDAGELLMRGPTRFLRYHDDPEQTARDDRRGRLVPLGRPRPHGRRRAASRSSAASRTCSRSAARTSPRPRSRPSSSRTPPCEIVQVVGAPDARYVEVPAAFVQLTRGRRPATEQELIDYCRGRIATFKVPRYVRFVDEWPMSGTKIQKFQLRERIDGRARGGRHHRGAEASAQR